MKKTNSISIFIFILLLASLGQVAADLYLPSLPAIAHGLRSSIGSAQQSVAVYLLGFSLSQLIYGPLSDSAGRKKPLLAGLGLLLIGSLLCASTSSITEFIIGRCLQGFGTGATFVLSRTMLRDTFSGNNLAKFGSYLAAGSIVIMASAPMIGGYIQEAVNWRGNFILLNCYTVTMLILVCFHLPETHSHKNRSQLNSKQLIANISMLIKNKIFVSMTLVIFLTYACIVAWLTSGPVLLESQLGLSPVQFGWIDTLTGVAYGVGSIVNSQLLSRYGIKAMIIVGLAIMLSASLLMLTLEQEVGIVNIYSVVIPVAIFIAGTGFVFANVFACALNPFAKIAGIASCVFGCMEILGGVLSSTLLSHIHHSSPSVLAIIFLVASGIMTLSLLNIKKKIA